MSSLVGAELRSETTKRDNFFDARTGREDLIAMKERAAADPTLRESKRLRDRADVELVRGDVTGPEEGW
jgi:hypothetical protein